MTKPGLESMRRAVWWLVLLRGALAILFGVFALFAPGTALLALVAVFGAYALIDGVMAIVLGVRHRKTESHWVWHVVQGVISVIAGLVAFSWPGVTVLVLLFLIAFWSVVGGISQIMESFAMRRLGSGRWGWILASGIVSVLFGIVLFAQPGAGLVTLLWLVGTFSIVFGVIFVVWALSMGSTDPNVGFGTTRSAARGSSGPGSAAPGSAAPGSAAPGPDTAGR